MHFGIYTWGMGYFIIMKMTVHIVHRHTIPKNKHEKKWARIHNTHIRAASDEKDEAKNPNKSEMRAKMEDLYWLFCECDVFMFVDGWHSVCLCRAEFVRSDYMCTMYIVYECFEISCARYCQWKHDRNLQNKHLKRNETTL